MFTGALTHARRQPVAFVALFFALSGGTLAADVAPAAGPDFRIVPGLRIGAAWIGGSMARVTAAYGPCTAQQGSPGHTNWTCHDGIVVIATNQGRVTWVETLSRRFSLEGQHIGESYHHVRAALPTFHSCGAGGIRVLYRRGPGRNVTAWVFLPERSGIEVGEVGRLCP